MNLDVKPVFKALSEVAFSSHNVTGGGGGWEDLDLSGDCAAGAKYALIQMTPSGGALSIGIRKNGSSIERRLTVSPGVIMGMIVELDGNRVIEVYNPGGANINIYMVEGYWS